MPFASAAPPKRAPGCSHLPRARVRPDRRAARAASPWRPANSCLLCSSARAARGTATKEARSAPDSSRRRRQQARSRSSWWQYVAPCLRHRSIGVPEMTAKFYRLAVVEPFAAQDHAPATGHFVVVGDSLENFGVGINPEHAFDGRLRTELFERRTLKVDHQADAFVGIAPIPVSPPRLHDPRLRRPRLGIFLPQQAVFEFVGLLKSGCGIGYPIRDDVVVGFIGRWDLHQFDAPGAPPPLGLYPRARPPIVTRFEVFIVRKIAIALHQPEANRIGERERGDQQALGIRQWPPWPFARARVDLKPIRIVHLGAEVISDGALV